MERERFTRECLAAEVGRTFTARDVMLTIGMPQSKRIWRESCCMSTIKLGASVRLPSAQRHRAFHRWRAQSPELLGIFVHGSTPDKLIEQITCGDVGIEKAVIIPKILFPLLLLRLAEFSTSNEYKSESLSAWRAKSAIQGFLARRCSKEFLSLYVDKNPDILDEVSKPGLYLSVGSKVDLAVRLYELGLLPENNRKMFVAKVSEYAITGQDLYALEDVDIRKVFTDHEFQELKRNVHTRLLPRLDDVRLHVQLNHNSDETPEEHMAQLLGSFEALKNHFADDTRALETIEHETVLAKKWISDHTYDEERERKPRTLGKVEMPDNPHGVRSIFDDVDA